MIIAISILASVQFVLVLLQLLLWSAIVARDEQTDKLVQTLVSYTRDRAEIDKQIAKAFQQIGEAFTRVGRDSTEDWKAGDDKPEW